MAKTAPSLPTATEISDRLADNFPEGYSPVYSVVPAAFWQVLGESIPAAEALGGSGIHAIDTHVQKLRLPLTAQQLMQEWRRVVAALDEMEDAATIASAWAPPRRKPPGLCVRRSRANRNWLQLGPSWRRPRPSSRASIRR